MTWQVPRMWEGGDVWIIGGGPSVPKQFGIPDEVIQSVVKGTSPPSVYSPYMSYLHNKHVIGINVAYLIGNWIDMVFFGDSGFFLSHQQGLANFPGLRVSCHPGSNGFNWVKYLPRDKSHPRGINSNPKMVSWNKNSGAAAISVAAHTGAKRIMLLGFDMKLAPNANQHWHNLYGKNANRNDKKAKMHMPFALHMKGFPEIAKDAKRMGIEILNVCPESAITVFPKVNFKDISIVKDTMKNIFTDIFENRRWNSEEAVSGTGSELKATVNIREQIPIIFKKYGIKRVLDIGCGDFNWMQLLVKYFDYYLGIDVVSDLIEKNVREFGSGKVLFEQGEVENIELNLYNFDVVVLSDVLVHLSFMDIEKVLCKLRKSNIKYILMTHFTGLEENRDVKTGDWRRLRFDIEPFNFSIPLEIISHCDEGESALDKTLSLWSLETK